MSRPLISAVATSRAWQSQLAGRPAGSHEAVIEPLIRQHPVTVLCLYDRSRMDQAASTAVAALHEQDRARPGVFDDGWLRITSAGPARLHLAGELDFTNREALIAALDQAQADADAAGRVLEVDLASLRFCDGIRALVTAARGGPRIRLLRPQPMVRWLLDLIDPDGVVFPPGEGRGGAQD